MNIIIPPPNSAVLLHFNGFSLRYYGFFMAISFLVGVIFSYLLLQKKYSKDEAEVFFDYSPYLILGSILGARLFYIIGSFKFYLKFPQEIFMINHGGLSIFGAIFFGIVFIFLFSKIKKFSFWSHLDTLAVVFPLCQSIGRFGNYFNQEAYGLPYDGMIKLYVEKPFRLSKFINVEYYHPTFLYESLLDLVIFLMLFTIFIKSKNLKKGTISAIYLILYALVRLFVENIRLDSVLNIANLHIASIICVFAIILSLIWLYFIYKK